MAKKNDIHIYINRDICAIDIWWITASNVMTNITILDCYHDNDNDDENYMMIMILMVAI